MSLLLLIPLLPLIGFAINGLAYPKLSKSIAGIVGTIPPLVAFVISLQLFLNFDGQTQIIQLADWIKVADLSIHHDAIGHHGCGYLDSFVFHGLHGS